MGKLIARLAALGAFCVLCGFSGGYIAITLFEEDLQGEVGPAGARGPAGRPGSPGPQGPSGESYNRLTTFDRQAISRDLEGLIDDLVDERMADVQPVSPPPGSACTQREAITSITFINGQFFTQRHDFCAPY